MTTLLSNSEKLREVLYEFLNQFKEDGYLTQGNTDDTLKAIEALIEQVCNESRIDELKQLWNYTQSDIVPEGAKPNDMSDRLHERIKTLTKESES